MKLKWIMGLVTAAVFSLGLSGAQAQEELPDATIKLSATSFGLGFGGSWGSGTLTYKGQNYPIDIQGFSFGDVGISSIDANGKVYNLKNLDDFNGNYAAAEAGMTLGGGGTAFAMKNQNGVSVTLVSTTRGLEFTLGFSSMVMKVYPPKIVAAAPAPVRAPAPVAAPAPVPSKIRFSTDELFEFDKAVLKLSPSRNKLDEFAARLKTLLYDSINVIGYTDRIGSEEYNKRLSLRRAEAVKNYLVTQGVDSEKILVEGRGKADPITGNWCQGSERTKALIACLEPDRRVEVGVYGTQETK